jgi:hypothetical protein
MASRQLSGSTAMPDSPDNAPVPSQDPAPQGWCVCGTKADIAEAEAVTLPNGRPGWQGYCAECGSPLFAIRRPAKQT